MKVEIWSIDKVIPYARNPRKNDSAVPKVMASLKEYGFRQPIVVDKEGVVIVGHTRLKAAQQLGMTEVPVHTATGLTASQVKAYRIADNRTSEEAEWDQELLGLELSDLREADFDLNLTGFDQNETQTFDVAPVDAPQLPDGDRAPFRQMTFTVHDEQFEEIEAALRKAKEAGRGESAVNENSNGNALAWICDRFNRG